MAPRRSILDVLDEIAPEVARAFVESVNRMTSEVDMEALEDAIKRQNVSEVLRILDFGPEYYSPYRKALRDAFEAGGDWTFEDVKKRAKRARVTTVFGHFDATNERAERWLTENSSRLVTSVSEAQTRAIRSALVSSFSRGDGPRTTALDIVGRVNRVTGLREGGIVGLTPGQESWANSAFEELTSGDGSLMRNYFRRKLRNRQFDSVVTRAILEDRPVSATDARRIVAKYKNRILKHRGDTISRTETLSALHQSQNEGLTQMVESGKLEARNVVMEWDASEDSATRDSHRFMEGQKRPLNQPFVSGDGNLLNHPGDTSHGAPGSEVINCRCRLISRIDFISGLADRLSAQELESLRS